MNHLLIGHADKTDRLLQVVRPPFLLVDDGQIADAFAEHFPKAKRFDVAEHHFNPLRSLDYKKARDFAQLLYSISPQGENTLTVRNGKRALTTLLLDNPGYLHKLPRSSDPIQLEALGMIDDLLLSPVLQSVLCKPTNFPFKGNVIAKLDRAQLGDFDALVLGSLLMAEHQGQIIVPDFGFYGHDFYLSFIRHERLTCCLNSLSEVPDKLQQALLGVTDKTIYRITKEDAARLIVYTKHTEPNILVGLSGDSYEIGQ